MAALLCDFSVWAARYSLSALIFFLSLQAIVQGRNEKEKSFFLFSLALSAQPRSVKAVCRALNKLIPYLWGSGTIYPGCNVIRGQGGEQGPSRCSAWLTHTHFITWHCSFFPITPTPQQPPRWLRCSYRKWENSLFFPGYQSRSKISRSAVNPCSWCALALH